MGTDIHLYIERRTANGWERVRPEPWACPWCDGKEQHPPVGGSGERSCHWCGGADRTAKEYHVRNYDLFAMLANVRNGHGFAGCDTGDGFVSLAEPRGLPGDTSIKDTLDDDASDEEVEAIDYDSPDYVWLGDHSHSHCTLAEALTYDYSRTTKHRGTVDASEFAAWVEAGRKGPPKSFSGGVMGTSVKTISQEGLQRLIQDGRIDLSKKAEDRNPFSLKADDGFSYYTVVEWEETYRNSAGRDWFAFLEACRALGKPEDVRLVFGFDS